MQKLNDIKGLKRVGCDQMITPKKCKVSIPQLVQPSHWVIPQSELVNTYLVPKKIYKHIVL